MPNFPEYWIPPPPIRPDNANDKLVWKYWERGQRLGYEEGKIAGEKEVEEKYAKKSRRGFLKDISIDIGTGTLLLGTLYSIGRGFRWIVDRRNKIKEEKVISEKSLKQIKD